MVQGPGHRLPSLALADAQGAPSDLFRLVARLLQIAGALRQGHDQPQVDGGRLALGDDVKDALVDGHFLAVDLAFAIDNLPCQIDLALGEGTAGGADLLQYPLGPMARTWSRTRVSSWSKRWTVWPLATSFMAGPDKC